MLRARVQRAINYGEAPRRAARAVWGAGQGSTGAAHSLQRFERSLTNNAAQRRQTNTHTKTHTHTAGAESELQMPKTNKLSARAAKALDTDWAVAGSGGQGQEQGDLQLAVAATFNFLATHKSDE